MTGVLNAVVAGGTKFIYSVTVANLQGLDGAYGYNFSTEPSGAISPSTFRGVDILVASAWAGPTNFDFNLSLDGPALEQSFFQYVMVQGTDGSWRTYHSADADFFVPGELSNIWAWEADGPPWTATSPSPRTIIIAN
jgi:hypothetical protein